MKGKNSITLNQESINEALNEYLGTNFSCEVKVTDVVFNHDARDSINPEWIITFEAKQ